MDGSKERATKEGQKVEYSWLAESIAWFESKWTCVSLAEDWRSCFFSFLKHKPQYKQTGFIFKNMAFQISNRKYVIYEILRKHIGLKRGRLHPHTDCQGSLYPRFEGPPDPSYGFGIHIQNSTPDHQINFMSHLLIFKNTYYLYGMACFSSEFIHLGGKK